MSTIVCVVWCMVWWTNASAMRLCRIVGELTDECLLYPSGAACDGNFPKISRSRAPPSLFCCSAVFAVLLLLLLLCAVVPGLSIDNPCAAAPTRHLSHAATTRAIHDDQHALAAARTQASASSRARNASSRSAGERRRSASRLHFSTRLAKSSMDAQRRA